MDMIPTELNPKADEALCSICGQWFCYNHRNPSSSMNMAPDNITEIVEKIYNGEIDEEIIDIVRIFTKIVIHRGLDI